MAVHTVNVQKAEQGCIYLDVFVNNLETKLVIDSGASTKHFLQGSQQITDRLCLADGSDVPVIGVAKLSWQIGPITVYHDTILADIQADGLLGNSFLSTYECDLFYSRQEIVIAGETFSWETGNTNSCRVVLKTQAFIPQIVNTWYGEN